MGGQRLVLYNSTGLTLLTPVEYIREQKISICGGRIQRIDSIPILIVKIQIEVYLSVILQMICGSFT